MYRINQKIINMVRAVFFFVLLDVQKVYCCFSCILGEIMLPLSWFESSALFSFLVIYFVQLMVEIDCCNKFVFQLNDFMKIFILISFLCRVV